MIPEKDLWNNRTERLLAENAALKQLIGELVEGLRETMQELDSMSDSANYGINLKRWKYNHELRAKASLQIER